MTLGGNPKHHHLQERMSGSRPMREYVVIFLKASLVAVLLVAAMLALVGWV